MDFGFANNHQMNGWSVIMMQASQESTTLTNEISTS